MCCFFLFLSVVVVGVVVAGSSGDSLFFSEVRFCIYLDLGKCL